MKPNFPFASLDAPVTERHPFMPAAMHGGKSRVLIVEDNPDTQWQLARLLTVRGHRVVGTSSSEGALALMTRWTVDMVLIDDSLPHVRGIELAEQLHRDHPALSLGVMSEGLDRDTWARVRAIRAAYLSKPVTLDAMLALLERRLRPFVASVPALRQL